MSNVSKYPNDYLPKEIIAVSPLHNLAHKTSYPMQCKNVATDEQVVIMEQELGLTKVLRENSDSVFWDRPIPGQSFAIVNCIPCVGATPNKDGEYAFCKVRAVTATQKEAEDIAADIIKNQDQLSRNTIIKVGVPFPVTLNHRVKGSLIYQVDIKENVKNSVNLLAKNSRKEDIEAAKELEEKKKLVQAEAEVTPTDFDDYCTQSNKVIYWLDTVRQMEQEAKNMRAKLAAARIKLAESNALHPEYKADYYTYIKEKEKEAGYEKGKSSEMDAQLEQRELVYTDCVEAIDKFVKESERTEESGESKE